MNALPEEKLRSLIRDALEEDLGEGDVTTDAVIPADAEVEGEIVAGEALVAAGLELCGRVFKILDPAVLFQKKAEDGQGVEEGAVLARLSGRALPILKGERTALNFLQRLSGIATETARYVALASPHGAAVLDTRKTTPGLRALEKYAVRMGGGENHRFGLFDGVLIKDNHLAILSRYGPHEIERAVSAVRKRHPELPLEIEVTSLEEAERALHFEPDILLLDNMSVEEIAAAVRLVGGSCLTEASGNITLENVERVARTGVDRISVGALTHSAPSADISLEIAG